MGESASVWECEGVKAPMCKNARMCESTIVSEYKPAKVSVRVWECERVKARVWVWECEYVIVILILRMLIFEYEGESAYEREHESRAPAGVCAWFREREWAWVSVSAHRPKKLFRESAKTWSFVSKKNEGEVAVARESLIIFRKIY